MYCRLILLLLLISGFVRAQEIIPQPNSYKQSAGNFKVSETLTVSCSDAAFKKLIPGFSASVRKYTFIKIRQVPNNATIQLVRNPKISGKEAYRLKVESKKITIEAASPAGCFYGLQSLEQLIHGDGQAKQIACGEISDQPRYEWRGLMIDESRHFFGVDEVKKILDLMALNKLNKFHWHLTDSPGWRIEIKKYPLLTSLGAKGNHSNPEAEAAWTNPEVKNYANFQQRMVGMEDIYRKSEVSFFDFMKPEAAKEITGPQTVAQPLDKPASARQTLDTKTAPAPNAKGDGKANQEYVSGWKSEKQSINWEVRAGDPTSFEVEIGYVTAGKEDKGTVFLEVDGIQKPIEYQPFSFPYHPFRKPGSIMVGKINLVPGIHNIKLFAGKFTGAESMRPLFINLIPVK